MALSPGAFLGPYEIVSLIGAGGMGEVYRARDPRLGRDVAIKVLPASLAADPDRRERFEREARAASALNHPHICALYDVGRHDGIDYLVMELVDGESLEKRLARGPMPVEQALRLGIEIADALNRAHRQGIVHRDLKPANVMLTKHGAKLLDFGLARMDAAPAAASGSFMPTQQKSLTQAGTVLGTFQYMAPEQLEGGDADARTDIFAFGALLYEAVTGRKAFEGKSQASLISAIMAGTPPPISTLQPMAPPALDRVVRTCLEKDPDDRWQTARDLGAELKWIAEGGSQISATVASVPRRRSRERWAWIAAAIFAVIAAASTTRLLVQREEPKEPARFAITPPHDVTISWPRISPDGRTVAFVGVDTQNKRSIWLRPVESFDATEMPGTEGVARPFWSPDSKYLAFFVGSQLKRIAVSGGPPLLICDAARGSDGSWGDGVILFDGNVNDPIRRVPAAGGVPTIAVEADRERKEVGVAWPFFLPDGHHFLFVGNDSGGPVTIKVGSIDSRDVKVLGDTESRVEYSSDHLFYAAQQTLMARPFSPRTLAFAGDPFPVADKIQVQSLGLVELSVSRAGDLAYASDSTDRRSQLVWVDRSGKEIASVGDRGLFTDIALSPDDTRAAVGLAGTGGRSTAVDSVWVMDLRRGALSRLTFGDKAHGWPIWSPDGTHVAFSVVGDAGIPNTIMQKLASGAGDEATIARDDSGILVPTDWSRDGNTIMSMWLPPAADTADLVTIAAHGRGAIAGFLRSPKPINEASGRFSPDGKWVAYSSNESGRSEVYIQSYPPSGGKWQVSTAGGGVAMWGAEGKEIVYSSGDEFMAVPVTATSGGLEVGTPTRLFQRRLAHGARERNRWALSRDGKRFLLNASVAEANTRAIQVVLNWTAGLNKR